ncbi:hypothetical protein IW261DRAFT_110358 [Armillaria novae-zelandiae]|uniref:Mitochondrial import inner membrane translocase subunit TIM50 n=1 Tax=Armillaria novae-zelandiae TaxID=153914 RepID=A0AA39P9T2_9AGAR|nr:hypothetical protein IW261DRAFT_110358 [Armillaria novae-zelandiae]
MSYRGHGHEYYAHVDPNGLDYTGEWNDGISYPQYHESSYRQNNGQPWPQAWGAYGYYNSQWQAQPYDYYAPEARRWSPRRRDPSSSPPPIPTEPSSDYLELSQQPSTHIDDPSSSRKLLILDLNGTLLYREGKPQGPRRYRRDRVNGSSEPQHRVAHPRPYMGSFRQYLFHPKTLEWLDTMVWSSAQPFNVDHMVGQCFKEEKEKLIAVWARDTLGLTSAQYHQKTQTTKDLAKPWAALSLLPDRNDEASTLSSSDDGPSHSADEPAPTSEPSRSAYAHSALTTLLLDDSPLKAQLQPWNHFCVPEYTAQIRGRDLSAQQRERDKPSSDIQDADAVVPQKKRKRPKKALSYDQILLAVIGVLDTIKGESNVSGWMRQCGLWNGMSEKEDEEKSTLTHEGTTDDEVENSETSKCRRIDDIVLDGKKARSSDSEKPDSNSPAAKATSISPEEPSVRSVLDDAPPSSLLLRAQSRPTSDDRSSPASKRKKSSLPHSPLSPPPLPLSSQMTEHESACSSPRFEAITVPGQGRKPQDNFTSASPQPPDNQHLNPSSPSRIADKHKLWFENEAVVSHWAKLGVDALAALGISAEAGI